MPGIPIAALLDLGSGHRDLERGPHLSQGCNLLKAEPVSPRPAARRSMLRSTRRTKITWPGLNGGVRDSRLLRPSGSGYYPNNSPRRLAADATPAVCVDQPLSPEGGSPSSGRRFGRKALLAFKRLPTPGMVPKLEGVDKQASVSLRPSGEQPAPPEARTAPAARATICASPYR